MSKASDIVTIALGRSGIVRKHPMQPSMIRPPTPVPPTGPSMPATLLPRAIITETGMGMPGVMYSWTGVSLKPMVPLKASASLVYLQLIFLLSTSF